MANNIHMKITGPDIAGEGTDGNHVGEIVVQSVQHGASRNILNGGAGGTREAGNANMNEFVVTKLVDKATALIFKSVATGGPHSEVKITFDKKSANGSVVGFLVYTLKGVLISSQHISGSDGVGVPMESVGLNFLEVKMEYTPTHPTTGDAEGVIPFAFDVSKSQEV